jgi:hypothetical protein
LAFLTDDGSVVVVSKAGILGRAATYRSWRIVDLA